MSYTYCMLVNFEIGDLILLKEGAAEDTPFFDLNGMIGIVVDGPRQIYRTDTHIWYAYFDEEFPYMPVGPYYFIKISE